MNVRPAYKLVEKNFLMPIDELFAKLDSLVTDNRHFEFFWFPYSDVAVCKSLNESERARARSRAAPKRCTSAARKGERRMQRAFGCDQRRCCPTRRSC